MLEKLKEEVYKANMDLPKYGLVTFTWGNVSGIDREKGLFVIKPSGVDYDKLKPEDMVVVDLQGNKVEGEYNPSSDTATHVVLYNAFPNIGGSVHTQSSWATSWAQAGRGIPCYGPTHADYIYGEVPCERTLTKVAIDEANEKNTGVLIADYFKDKDYEAVPAVLCKNHGPFTWGKDAHEAVHNAVVLEEVAKMASRSVMLNHLGDKVSIICGDLKNTKTLFGKGVFNVVTVNPPYMAGGSGLVGADYSKAVSRHEILCSLEDVIRESANVLVAGGRMYMVHRPYRLGDIICLMNQYKMSPRRLCMVHPKASQEANLVLIEGIRGGNTQIRVEAPLVLFDEDGQESKQIKMIHGRL